MKLWCLSLFVSLLVNDAACHNIDKALHRERETDGSFPGRGETHHSDEGQHNTDFDHESILGSSHDAEQFDHLAPEESKRRLSLLLDKMDTNGDKMIDTREMQAWILRSFQMLSAEESSERFEEADEDGDERVTWEEHLQETFGVGSEDELPEDGPEGENTRMVREDRELFQRADGNSDGVLDEAEFLSFSHPEETEAMVPLLVQQALLEKDLNHDGKISFSEYVGQRRGEEHSEESLLTEKERFDEDYDTNMDGELDPVEVRHWLVPDNVETAASEVAHLFASADADEDGKLSYAEVLDQHDLFVGSEVTDYGDHLHNIERFEDEL